VLSVKILCLKTVVLESVKQRLERLQISEKWIEIQLGGHAMFTC
jgi:hypothetical protein